MKVKVCVPVPAESFNDVFTMISRAERSGADIIELRLDYLGHSLLDYVNRLGEIVEFSKTPLIATNRSVEQGGRCVLDEERRLETLISAARAGFKYIDVELSTSRLDRVIDAVRAYDAKVIVSSHNFKHTPHLHEMEKTVKAQIEAGADICKVVTMANSIADSVSCLIFTYEISRKADVVCFAMGEKGLLSRVLSPLFGAQFTYASLGKNLETAPGQITIEEVKEFYRRLGVW
ncbi:MAG: type I 3-dehydroquinate dehydratase [Candidatus Bathyarchaeota archaeon]|nr:type I 3-dehydroquinate dehydratase [Candidatus Bathyarchaeota archaeon]